MPLNVHTHTFYEDDAWLHMHRSFPKEKEMQVHIHFATNKFTDYQKNIFQDFLAPLVDVLSDETMYIDDFKASFEKELQSVNSKLSIFAEKMTSVENFIIKWVVQVFFEREYISSLIGNVWLMVVRDNDLNYMMSNKEDDHIPISLFSEIIEWEVREFDEIVIMGIPVDTYIDKADFATIRDIHLAEEKTFVEWLLELLEVRVSKEDIAFALVSQRESKKLLTQKKIKKNMTVWVTHLQKLSDRIAPYNGYLVYAAIGLFAFLMVIWLYQSFDKTNEARFVDTSWDVLIDFTIEDIQKDIMHFTRIDPQQDQKVRKYQEIVSKLALLEENNRWTNDVKELKKILETEYYDGFNIVFADEASVFNSPVYEFSQQEKNTLASVHSIFYNNGLMIWGTEGVVLWAINNEVRGTLVSAAPGMEFDVCGTNLLKNGLYCASTQDTLYNVTKWWVNPLTNASSIFPSQITDISTFGNANMYVLTRDASLNSASTYLVKYRNIVWSQESFGEGAEYILWWDTEGRDFAWSWLNAFAIDGSFLTRSPTQRAVYQLWRPGAWNVLEYREVPIVWWDTIEPYSEDTRIIASLDSRFVYLFDKQNQTFTVYKSAPYKTNDANTYTYSLQYFFRIKFGALGKEVVDLYVEEGEKSNLYVLTENGVYGVKLHEYMDTFFEKEANSA